MGDTALHHKDFDINVNLGGRDETIKIKPEETTDGAAYFKCSLSGKELTQIRKEKDNDWEQIWGELNREEVSLIGTAIDKQLAIDNQ